MQIIHQPVHAQHFRVKRIQRFPAHFPDAVLQGFDFSAQNRERGSQFMGNVRNPLTPHLFIFSDGLCHTVEILRQLPQFIFAAHRNMGVKTEGSQCLRSFCQFTDRHQEMPGKKKRNKNNRYQDNASHEIKHLFLSAQELCIQRVGQIFLFSQPNPSRNVFFCLYGAQRIFFRRCLRVKHRISVFIKKTQPGCHSYQISETRIPEFLKMLFSRRSRHIWVKSFSMPGRRRMVKKRRQEIRRLRFRLSFSRILTGFSARMAVKKQCSGKIFSQHGDSEGFCKNIRMPGNALPTAVFFIFCFQGISKRVQFFQFHQIHIIGKIAEHKKIHRKNHEYDDEQRSKQKRCEKFKGKIQSQWIFAIKGTGFQFVPVLFRRMHFCILILPVTG